MNKERKNLNKEKKKENYMRINKDKNDRKRKITKE